MDDSPYHCDHENVELRERTHADGSVHYVEQCLRCGQQLRAYKRDSNNVAQAKLHGGISQFDEQIREDFCARGFVERRTQREDEKAEWFAWYSEYLQSPEWQDKRAKVLERDNYTCQGCGAARAAMIVHHLSYQHVGNEFLFELTSVCERCHKRLHDE